MPSAGSRRVPFAVRRVTSGFASLSGGALTATASVTGLSWEVNPLLSGDGADVYVEALDSLTINVLDIDTALIANSGTGGTVEALCTGAVSRGGTPVFGGGTPEYITLPQDENFGDIDIQIPSGSGLSVAEDPYVAGGRIYSIILKVYASSAYTASATSRHVTTWPDLALNAGDYLGFHVDGSGGGAAGSDVRTTIVFGYS